MTVCAECGESNPDEARFCNACGAALRGPVRPGFEVRKTVTILFCDVVGSTAIGERTDPETTRKVMSRYSAEMSTIVERHGGTVEKFRGDEVMAVFGVPTVHEDDALRAVRTAMAMQRRLRELNEEIAETWGVELKCRIGINTGEVVAGDLGTGESFVTGDAVNLAKRLEQAAGTGEILIGTGTYPLVKDAVTVGPRQRFSAKGKRKPVSRFRLDDVDETAAGYARRLDAPLVGRREELERLESLVGAAFSDGRCEVVLIVGPAGIGKSRLARELAARMAPRARVATGRCLPYGSGITYWPLVELVQELGGMDAIVVALDGAGDGETVLERVRAALGRGDASVPSDEVFWGIRRLFERLAAEQPLLICLEDVHWAEPTMLDLVEYLAAFATGPLVLSCMARADLLETRPGFARAATLELDHLSEDDMEQLLLTLGVEDRGVRRRIVSTAEGNALFGEQLAAMVSDHAPSGESIELPASIQALLAARLDGLEPAERRALERAAVVGKEFWQRAVADLSSETDRPLVAGRLLALVRKGLVRPARSGLPGEDAYVFRHALIRDAAYTAMPKAVRADLHERLARWLEREPAAGFGAHDEILGYHLEQAYRCHAELRPVDAADLRLAEEAAERLLSAGTRAFARDDMPAAALLLGRAAALLPEGDTRRLDALRDRSLALWEAGQAEEGAAALAQLLAEAEHAGERRVVALARLEGVVHEQLTGADSTVVQAAAELAIELCSEAGDEVGLARAWRRLSSAHRRAGAYAAAELAARRAVDHARSARDSHEEARAVDGLCNALLYGPTPVDVALVTCAELRGSPGRSRALDANVLGAVAGLEAMRGDFEAARTAYARAAGILEELGLELPRAALTQVGAPLELLAGDAAGAEREARRGAEIFARFGSAGVQAPLIAAALEAQGRLDEAERELDATPVESGPQLAQWQVHWRIVKSRVLRATERAPAAVDVAHEAVGLAEQTDDLSLRGDAHSALAEALAAADRAQEASRSATAARAAYAAKGSTAALAESADRAPSPA